MSTQKSKKELVAEMRKQLIELDEFLTYGYVKQVKELLTYAVEDSTVHAVKSGQRNTITILAAILNVAKENRNAALKSIER